MQLIYILSLLIFAPFKLKFAIGVLDFTVSSQLILLKGTISAALSLNAKLITELNIINLLILYASEEKKE